MEILRLPDNQDLYEKHKAQARERTRRYRAKLRQNKLQQQVRTQRHPHYEIPAQTESTQPPHDNFLSSSLLKWNLSNCRRTMKLQLKVNESNSPHLFINVTYWILRETDSTRTINRIEEWRSLKSHDVILLNRAERSRIFAETSSVALQIQSVPC